MNLNEGKNDKTRLGSTINNFSTFQISGNNFWDEHTKQAVKLSIEKDIKNANITRISLPQINKRRN